MVEPGDCRWKLLAHFSVSSQPQRSLIDTDIISRLLQLLLVLLSILEKRRAKKLAMAGPAPPYACDAGPYAVDTKEKEKNIEVDWKSVVSEESLADSVKRPESVKA